MQAFVFNTRSVTFMEALRLTRHLAISLMFLGLFSLGGGCKPDIKNSPPESTETSNSQLQIPERFPPNLPWDQFVGANTCQGCHQDEHEAWSKSPHGRAMAKPNSKSVKAPFDGRAIVLGDGSGYVVPLRDGHDYGMQLNRGTQREYHRVDLVLASGRQQQLYLTDVGHGSYKILPIFWLPKENRWTPTSVYQPGSLDPTSESHWQNSDLNALQCMRCHLSQFTYEREEATLTPQWVDLSVNCESCHGPGKQHVRDRRAGKATPYSDLHNIDKQQDARLCGRCHAKGHNTGGWGHNPEDGLPNTVPVSIDHDFRPDATQLFTVYQLGAHLSSSCYSQGALKCSHCHAPHTQQAIDLTGQSAEGSHVNRQCTVCHRNLQDESQATQHSRHSQAVDCVECHMGNSWTRNNPDAGQQTSDHSIQIPHPKESIEAGTINACNTCHTDKSAQWSLNALTRWGAQKATTVRPWVKIVALLLEGVPVEAREIDRVLKGEKLPQFVRDSILTLIAEQPENPEFVPIFERYVKDPDENVRWRVLKGIIKHNRARKADWWARANQDPSVVVRLQTMWSTTKYWTPASVRRYLEETLGVSYGMDWANECADIAEERQSQGHSTEAMELAQLALELDLSNIRAHSVLVVGYLELGDITKATEHLDAVSDAGLTPDFASSLANKLTRNNHPTLALQILGLVGQSKAEQFAPKSGKNTITALATTPPLDEKPLTVRFSRQQNHPRAHKHPEAASAGLDENLSQMLIQLNPCIPIETARELIQNALNPIAGPDELAPKFTDQLVPALEPDALMKLAMSQPRNCNGDGITEIETPSPESGCNTMAARAPLNFILVSMLVLGVVVFSRQRKRKH